MSSYKKKEKTEWIEVVIFLFLGSVEEQEKLECDGWEKHIKKIV